MVSSSNILNASILIVDDQEANVSLLEKMLHGAGYVSIASTRDPRAVCELHRKNNYCLILLDLQMPGMDGFEVMECLKEIETGGYLPVLVLTAQPDHKLRALKAGAKDFVSKPFDLAEVLLRVYNMLEVRLLHLETRKHNEQLESRVSERTAELKDSLHEMERFCYSIAHDLKAPLRAIKGLTTILTEDYAPAFDEAGKNCTRRIIEAATRMDLLIRDLLNYGQLTHMDVPFSSVNLSDEISHALENLRGEILSTEATIEVQKELPNVLANPVLLQQVLCNLIENALKFVKAGTTPCLKIWMEKRNQKSERGIVKPTTRLWIQDNGIGIAAAYTQRIFRLFERLHSEKSAYPGTGIGLALVQKAIERMNGIVGVESTVGEGSLFWIELPND